MIKLRRLALRAVVVAILDLVTLIVGGAYNARCRLPDLKPSHRLDFGDLTA